MCPVVPVILASHTYCSLLSLSLTRVSSPSQVNSPEIVNIPVLCFSRIVLISFTLLEDTGLNTKWYGMRWQVHEDGASRRCSQSGISSASGGAWICLLC